MEKVGRNLGKLVWASEEVTADTKAKIEAEMIEEWDKQNVGTIKSFQVAVVLAFKN